MLSKSNLTLSTVLGLMAVALPASASAQTAGSPTATRGSGAASDNDDTADIIVTANKREERLFDVASAISIVDGKSLEQSGAAQFSQYFDSIPGLSAVPAGQPGKAIVSIRGISTGASQTNATVGTYINDVPFGSSGGLAVGGLFIADPNTFDIDRIEVLKGPQGTLYGASTLGGLIKTVYASPQLGKLSGRAMIDWSQVEHGGLGAMANGMINLPVSDTVAIRAVGSYRRDPGFVDSVSSTNRRSDQNSADAYGGRLIALFKPTDAFSIELTAIYQKTDSHGLNQVDVDPTTLKPTVGDLQTAENFIQPRDRLEYQIYSGKAVYDTGPISMTNITSFGRYTENQVLDVTDGFGFGPVLPYATQIELKNFTEEFRLASSGASRFEWLVGVFYTHQDNSWNFQITGDNPVTLQPLVPRFNVYTFGGDPIKYGEVAGFGNATFHLSNKLSVTGGVRYSSNRQNYSYTRSGLVAGVDSVTTGRSSDQVVTYLGSVQFKPSENVLVYAKTANGYRPGGPQVSNLVGLNLPATFKPDKTRNYETGAKFMAFGNRLAVDVSGFYIDWSDIQLLQTVVVNVDGTAVRRSIIGNAGKASSRGVDFDIRYRATPDFNLGLSGGYTDAHVNEAAPSLGASAGERIPYSPRLSLVGSADYGVHVGSSSRLTLGAVVRYIGNRTNYFSADPSGYVQAVLPSYTLVDLHASLKIENFEVALRVNNVTDKRALLSAQGNAFNPAPPFNLLNDAAVVAQPRTYGVSLTKSF